MRFFTLKSFSSKCWKKNYYHFGPCFFLLRCFLLNLLDFSNNFAFPQRQDGVVLGNLFHYHPGVKFITGHLEEISAMKTTIHKCFMIYSTYLSCIRFKKTKRWDFFIDCSSQDIVICNIMHQNLGNKSNSAKLTSKPSMITKNLFSVSRTSQNKPLLSSCVWLIEIKVI